MTYSTTDKASGFSLAYYAGDRRTGSLRVVQRRDGETEVKILASDPGADSLPALKPILIGMTEDHRVILLDPRSKELRMNSRFPEDAFPAHIYSDLHAKRDWFMNDGDRETGNDTLNCGDRGSSVTVVENTGSSQAKCLKTICVGRGHHQAVFTYPSPSAPRVPTRAYISNLQDGTISVIGNEPGDGATYLRVLATINLCEPDKEEGGAEPAVPNKAFPHGMAYSPLTGKLYNLNNGYGTIAVIDPIADVIEERIAFKGHSNLFAAPGGRYLIGRGADRKSDPKHVIGKLAVLDVTSRKVVDQVDLPDIYLSKYYYNPEGTKLYLTTATSGSPEQQANLKADVLLIFDMTALPRLKLIKELKVGASGALAFHEVNGRTRQVFSSYSEGGMLVIVDGERDTVTESIVVAEGRPHSRIWMLNH